MTLGEQWEGSKNSAVAGRPAKQWAETGSKAEELQIQLMTPHTFDTLLSADFSCIKVIIPLLVFSAGKSLSSTVESFFIIYQMTDICFDVSVRTVSLCSNFDWDPTPPPILRLYFWNEQAYFVISCGVFLLKETSRSIICPIKFTWKMFQRLHTCLCHQALMSDRCWVFCRNPSSESYFEMLLLWVKWSHLSRKLLTNISVTIKDFTLHSMFIETPEKCDAVSLI